MKNPKSEFITDIEEEVLENLDNFGVIEVNDEQLFGTEHFSSILELLETPGVNKVITKIKFKDCSLDRSKINVKKPKDLYEIREKNTLSVVDSLGCTILTKVDKKPVIYNIEEAYIMASLVMKDIYDLIKRDFRFH